MSISIVVCTYNGKSRIIDCLASIGKQVGAPGFEVIVVDNASTDGTGNMVQEFLNSSFPLVPFRVLNEPNPGLINARISGMKAALYDWILFCDDDNVLFPDFLMQLNTILIQNSRIGVLGSHGIPQFLGAKPDWFDRYSSSYAVGHQLGNQSEWDHLVHVYGACSIYRKDPILAILQKGFNPVLSGRKGGEMLSGDDVEWCWLMQLLDYKIAYSPKLKFFHQISSSRLNWEYYIQLKKGISSSVGLLSSYQFYFSYSFRPSFRFVIWYFLKATRSFLLYLKYLILWKGRPIKLQDQLSLVILESQMRSYFRQIGATISHFNQLKKYFGS